MREYFKIDGYWKDDHSEFEGYIVTNYHDIDDDFDDDIFFYGLEKSDIEKAISDKENTIFDFVITSYEKL